MNRIIQISLDILIDSSINGDDYSETIAKILELNDINVIGNNFVDDLTAIYRKHGWEV